MIVAAFVMHIDHKNRKEVMQTFGSLYELVRSEKGCLSCRVYREVSNDDAVMFVEEWATQSDWESHLRSNEFAVLLGAMSLANDPAAVEFKLLSQAGGLELVKSIRGNE